MGRVPWHLPCPGNLPRDCRPGCRLASPDVAIRRPWAGDERFGRSMRRTALPIPSMTERVRAITGGRAHQRRAQRPSWATSRHRRLDRSAGDRIRAAQDHRIGADQAKALVERHELGIAGEVPPCSGPRVRRACAARSPVSIPRPWYAGSTSSSGIEAAMTPSPTAVMKPTTRPVGIVPGESDDFAPAQQATMRLGRGRAWASRPRSRRGRRRRSHRARSRSGSCAHPRRQCPRTGDERDESQQRRARRPAAGPGSHCSTRSSRERPGDERYRRAPR